MSCFQGFYLKGSVSSWFPILTMMPYYKPRRQSLIVVAYYTIHNGIYLSTLNNQLFRQYEVGILFQGEVSITSSIVHLIDLSIESVPVMTTCKDQTNQVIYIFSIMSCIFN